MRCLCRPTPCCQRSDRLAPCKKEFVAGWSIPCSYEPGGVDRSQVSLGVAWREGETTGNAGRAFDGCSHHRGVRPDCPLHPESASRVEPASGGSGCSSMTARALLWGTSNVFIDLLAFSVVRVAGMAHGSQTFWPPRNREDYVCISQINQYSNSWLRHLRKFSFLMRGGICNLNAMTSHGS